MNRFHSSGTARGNVDVMWMWNTIIPIIASVWIVPPRTVNSVIGSANSITVPRCAANDDWREGRMSSGWLTQSRDFAFRDRFHGVFEIITDTTYGKWRLSFDDAAPSQMHRNTICDATIMLWSGNRKTTSSGPYTSGRAARNETLSR